MKKIHIVFENSQILIINKPYGLAVQGGAGIVTSIIDILEKQIQKKIYLVHRLDKDTSGLMLVALSSKVASYYASLFKTKKIIKKYVAVCIGVPSNKKGCIEQTIRQENIPKESKTNWTLVSSNPRFSLLLLDLITGRMHQIRIHLASIQLPIVGDNKHGDFKQNKLIRSEFKVQKLQLASIFLSVPIDGVQKAFTIPLPDHISSACDSLGLSAPVLT